MQLRGTSLGKRQQELNAKVNEAASNNTDFDTVKAQDETDDLDKLFKIDLASKNKNVDYILEVLKRGDSLHITRALKCIWLYDDEYSNFINPDYIHQNVLPFLSAKMKRKLLTSISVHVRNESRAESFYTYLKKGMPHFADKFICFTSESFKLNLINNEIESLKSLLDNTDNFEQFFGNSFELVDAYLSEIEGPVYDSLYALRYLYFISDVKYLELLERYESNANNDRFNKRWGLRISKHFMKNHKQRIIDYLYLYMEILNVNMVTKYTTVEEAKVYAVRLLPEKSSTFWSVNFCKTYDFIINVLPFEERYEFIKKLFTEKYVEEPFELTQNFFRLRYQELMCDVEREAWALRHIESKKEILGAGEDFNWYRFVNFDKTFVEFKKYIFISSESEKRGRILAVVLETTRNQRDLEKLLNYYYERHVNESECDKRVFLDEVIEGYDVYDFDDDCWMAFNKILCSIDVYDMPIYDFNLQDEYRLMVLFYHMIHEKDFPEGLQRFMNTNLSFPVFRWSNSFTNLNKERQNKVCEYLLHFYITKLSNVQFQTYDESVREIVLQDVILVLDVLKHLERVEYPEIIKKFQELDPDYFCRSEMPKLTQNDLLRLLKQDTSLIVDKFGTIEHNAVHRSVRRFKLKQFLKKIKIYFSNDLAKEILELFLKFFSHSGMLNNPKRVAGAVVFVIIQLADTDFKHEFLTIHTPPDPKIDHYNIDNHVLRKQEAICRFVCYSRPPVPLSMISPYIKGDYLKYCLPMFNSYLSSLSPSLLRQLIESLLNAPVSIQKHGLRLAFSCYNSKNLKHLVLNLWKNTKNISLRMVIYAYLHKRIIKRDDDMQIELFEVLKSFTLDLNDDDHEELLKLLLDSDKIPEHLRGQFLEAVWKTLEKFADNNVTECRMVTTLNKMEHNCYLVEKDVLQNIIYEHIDAMILKKQILTEEKVHSMSLRKAKWALACTYFTKLNVDEENRKWIMNTFILIIKRYINMWNEDVSVVPKSCFELIQTLIDKNFEDEPERCVDNNILFESILIYLENSLHSHEIYMVVWRLRLTIIANKLVDKDFEDIARIYAKEVGKLLQESVKSRTYYKSLRGKIIDEIKKGISNIATVTGNRYKNDFRALVGMEFVDFGMLETKLLATAMLPSCVSSKYYSKLLEKIKMVSCDEVQTLLYQIFVDNDFKRDLANISYRYQIKKNRRKNFCLFVGIVFGAVILCFLFLSLCFFNAFV